MQYIKFIFGAHLARFANRFSMMIFVSGVFALVAHVIIRSQHSSYWSMSNVVWLDINAGLIFYFMVTIFGGLFLMYHKSPKHRPHPKSNDVATIDAALLYRWWFRIHVETRLTEPLNHVYTSIAQETQRFDAATKMRETLIADTEQAIENLPEASVQLVMNSSKEEIECLNIEITDAALALDRAKKRLEKLGTLARRLFAISTNHVEPLVFAFTRSKEYRVKMRIEHEINLILQELLKELEPVRQEWQNETFWDSFEPAMNPTT